MRRLCGADLPALRNAARTDRRARYWLILLLVVVSNEVSCEKPAAQQPSTGVAYVGPATLNLRKELASKSTVVAAVKHGDKLDVIETRRRFVRVRTTGSPPIEGWTDSTQLLTPQQMDDLERLAQSVAKLPSEGAATVFDALNVHADPNRQSPSFFQIPESGSVDVIGHRIAPRTVPPPSAPVRRVSTSKNSKAKRSKQPPLVIDPPKPPPVPANWEELSRPHVSDLPGYTPPVAKPVAMDDWSLVRTKEGKVGWVLSRMLTMSIPDEVAQYAEGHRITSYLPLGEVNDKENGQSKPNWLWTTIGSGVVPYEFDSFRVFVWSTKRHRYETAYIERNVQGYYPVRTRSSPSEDDKAFSLILLDKDGKLYEKTYAFNGYRVHTVSKVPYQPPPPLPDVHPAHDFEPVSNAAPIEISWRDRLRDWRKRWWGR